MALDKRIGVVKAELTNNPLGRDYSGTDGVVADLFNSKNRVKNLTLMTGSEIAQRIDEIEWKALSDVVQQKILALVGVDQLDPFGFAATVLKEAFPPGGATLTALGTARKQTVSRGTELELGLVFASDIRDARNS